MEWGWIRTREHFLYASIYSQKARKLVIKKSSKRGPVFVVVAWRGGVAWWSRLGREYVKQHALTGNCMCGRTDKPPFSFMASGRVVGSKPRADIFRLHVKTMDSTWPPFNGLHLLERFELIIRHIISCVLGLIRVARSGEMAKPGSITIKGGALVSSKFAKSSSR